MEKILFTLFLSILTISASNAQKVYVETNESKADVKVYVVQNESDCDLKVYRVQDESRVINDGLWYRVDYESQADLKVYFVDFELQAEIKIYYVDNESEAGWRNVFKSHVLRYKRS